MNYRTEWITGRSILSRHQHLRINQIYCWLVTSDQKVIIVSPDNAHWQLPGGHPEPDENQTMTLVREIKEETGLDIANLANQAFFIGYYVVDELDDRKQITNQYLQVRYYLKLGLKGDRLHLATHENGRDHTRQMHFVQAAARSDLIAKIKWLADSPEYHAVHF